jgi:hypothetical protein
MSEIGEQQIPTQEQLPPRRLEDMPQFQKLSPEQQEQLLSLRERMRAEADNPQHVVTRSINEMGFWEGLKETIKPHLKQHKEIMFKELKANASLALSLIPVIGEAKGLGSGLFGLTAKGGEAIKSTTKLKNIQFEPITRLGNAGKAAKEAWFAAKTAPKTAEKFMKFEKTSGSIFTRMAMKTADVLDVAGSNIKDKLRPVTMLFGAKTAAQHSLGSDFSHSAQEGSAAMARKWGVADIQTAQQFKRAEKAKAYAGVKEGVAQLNANQREWYKFPIRWARSAKGEVVARLASMKAGKEAAKGVTAAVEASLKSKNPVGRFVESGVKRAAPTAIEGTRFGAFKGFFEKWLNLTPDVPVWLSTTTGVMEFLGAHGIDAIPAALQMGINRFQQVKVSKDMALDVLSYTVNRGLRKVVERRQAAEVFTPAPNVGGGA